MYPTRNSDIKSTLLPDGHIVLFNTKTDWVHTLNPSGALVWEFCDGRHLTEEIVAELAAVTNSSDLTALKQQVSELIQLLCDQGMLLEESQDGPN